MNTKIILTIVVSLFVIGLVLVVATNTENNQTLSERTSTEIYQDYLDSVEKEKIIFVPIANQQIHGEAEINKAIKTLKSMSTTAEKFLIEYSDLPVEMQTEPNLDGLVSRMQEYGLILQTNGIEVLEAQKQIDRDFRITMERNGCDTCPIYSVSITGDGSVLYKGLQNVKEMGKREYSIPIEDVTELISFFYTRNEGTLKTQYGSTESDDSVLLTIELGYPMRITHYGDSGPEFLKQFEKKIEEIAMIKKFI